MEKVREQVLSTIGDASMMDAVERIDIRTFPEAQTGSLKLISTLTLWTQPKS